MSESTQSVTLQERAEKLMHLLFAPGHDRPHREIILAEFEQVRADALESAAKIAEASPAGNSAAKAIRASSPKEGEVG